MDQSKRMFELSKRRSAFAAFEEDFVKSMVDYLMFKEDIDVKEIKERIADKIIYNSNISENDSNILVSIDKE